MGGNCAGKPNLRNCTIGKMTKLNNQDRYSYAFYTVNVGLGFITGESKRKGAQCFVLDNSSVCL